MNAFLRSLLKFLRLLAMINDRTPLNCIIGMSSLLKDSDLSRSQEESVQMIVTSGDLLLTGMCIYPVMFASGSLWFLLTIALSVVDDVLDYSKLESGNVDIQITRSNLQETLNSVVHSIGTKFASNKVGIRCNYDPLLPEYIDTDSRRLQQILYNLLGNAGKFSRTGGTVELRVSVCSLSSLDANTGQKDAASYSPQPLELTNPGDRVLKVVVKDYGKGIAAEDYREIFSPFRQATSACTEVLYGGTGLGLSISSKLAHTLGGSISVCSRKNEWTEFTLAFPFRNDVVDSESIRRQLNGATAVFVGNDTESFAVAAESLGAYGADVHTYHSLSEADEAMRKCMYTMSSPPLNQTRSFVFVLHEDLYSRESYNSFVESSPYAASAVVLVTYGPRYAVEESPVHFRSLDQVLPSVMVDRILQCMSSAPQPSNTLDNDRKRNNIRKSSISDNGDEVDGIPYADLRILIAEDNLINQKVLSRMLQRLGVKHVDIVDDGQKAVEAEAAEPYDVVMMDMQMPRMKYVH